MTATWFDTASTLLAFSRISQLPQNVDTFRHVLVRLMSILNALCLHSLQNGGRCDDMKRHSSLFADRAMSVGMGWVSETPPVVKEKGLDRSAGDRGAIADTPTVPRCASLAFGCAGFRSPPAQVAFGGGHGVAWDVWGRGVQLGSCSARLGCEENVHVALVRTLSSCIRPSPRRDSAGQLWRTSGPHGSKSPQLDRVRSEVICSVLVYILSSSTNYGRLWGAREYLPELGENGSRTPPSKNKQQKKQVGRPAATSESEAQIRDPCSTSST